MIDNSGSLRRSGSTDSRDRSGFLRLAFGALAAAGSLAAQEPVPTLVRDIHLGPSGYDSSPSGIQEFDGAVFFNASAQGSSNGLWRTDGTAAGTVKVPKAVDGISAWDPRQFVEAGGIRYFAAWKTGVASRLWKTDGTGDGTSPVDNLPGVPFPNTPENLTECGGLLYFSVQHGNNEVVVWRSDGTKDGTIPLSTTDVTATNIPGGFSGVRSFVVLDDTLFFIAGKSEVWRSGGTLETTAKVAQPDLAAGEPIRELLPFDGALYFLSDRFSGADDLWRFDAAAESLVKIGGLPGEASWSWPQALRVHGDTLVMSAWDEAFGRELWQGDGSNFTRVADIAPGSASSNPELLVSLGKVLLFEADDGKRGKELWRTDGTPRGTYLVRDFKKGAADGGVSEACVAGSRVFFTAPGKQRSALWTSDGSKKGTRLVKEFNMDPYNSWLHSPAAAGDDCYFVGNDGIHGEELWRSDGTAAGTAMVADVAGGNGDCFFPGTDTAVFGGNYYFSGADKPRNHELWRSDGTEAGTFLLKDLAKQPYEGDPQRFVTVADRLVFSYSGKQYDELVWISDGTSKGTRAAKGWPGVPRGEDVAELPGASCFLHDGALFRVIPGGKEAPQKIGDGFEKSGTLGESKLVRFQGSLFLASRTGLSGTTSLWRSDGTAEGTVALASIPGSRRISWLTVADDFLYFFSHNGSLTELWKSDGSAAGTVKLHDLIPGSDTWSETFAIGDRLFFFRVGSSGMRLWTSDGTAAGTLAVKTFDSTGAPFFSQPVAMNGQLYFRAPSDSSIIDLWKTDGTPGGTVVVRNPATVANADPSELTVAGGLLYFSGYDRNSGRKLWRTDGTPEGTTMVVTPVPGASYSDPEGLRVVGDSLLFHATSPGIGRELWSLDLSGPAAPLLSATDSAARIAAAGDADGSGSAERDAALLHRAFHPEQTPAGIRRTLLPGTGVAGYPHVTAAGGLLRIEFVRRREPGWAYTPEYAFHLGPDAFLPVTGKIRVTVIDATWERVVAEQSYDPATTPRIFGRVQVTGP